MRVVPRSRLAVVAVVLTAAGITFAGPAYAASASPPELQSTDPLCRLWTNLPGSPSEGTVTGHVGDTFTVTMSGGFACGSLDFTTASGTPASPASGTLTISEPSTFTITGSGQLSFGSGTLLVDVVALPSTSTPTTTPVAAIPDWVQAIGRSGQEVSCPSGWTPSWQEWAVPVTGGWVCGRTIPSLG